MAMLQEAEYDLGYMIGRVVPSGRIKTEEQLKEVLTDASQRFYRAIQKAQHGTSGSDSDACSTQTA